MSSLLSFFLILFSILGFITGMLTGELWLCMGCFVGIPFGLLLLYIVYGLIKLGIESFPSVKRKVYERLSKQLLCEIEFNQEAYDFYIHTFNEVKSETIEDMVNELDLPPLDVLKPTIFYTEYEYFYMDKSGLVMLKTIEQMWDTTSPLMHPNIAEIINSFDPLDEREHAIITNYPWLMPL